MVEGSSQPQDATRFIETTRGLLSYQQLAPLLAERVLKVQQDIEDEAFASNPLNEGLILILHKSICHDLVPEWAGRWRSVQLAVGEHQPPPAHEVPMRMRDYFLDLQARLTAGGDQIGEDLLETLAFAEGRLLFIHPFHDFNGRVTRVFLWELLRRNSLPPVDLAPAAAGEREEYLSALRRADKQDWKPLKEIWRKRFESANLG